MLNNPLSVNTVDEAASWLSNQLAFEVNAKTVIDIELTRLEGEPFKSRPVSLIKAALPDSTYSYLAKIADHYDQNSKFPGFDVNFGNQGSVVAELCPFQLFEILVYGKTKVHFSEMEWEGYGKYVLVTDEFGKIITVTMDDLRLSGDSVTLLLNQFDTVEQSVNKKLTPVQQDKYDFQSKAMELWNNEPLLNRTEIKKKLPEYAAKYKGKNTLDNWLREIDSRPSDQRRGRPKKSLE